MSDPASTQLLSEHGFETVRGLPGELPPGERVVWQGAPRWASLAVHAFHIRKVALYLTFLIGINAYAAWQQTGSIGYVANTAVMPIGTMAACLALLALLAWISVKTTVYTITNRRLVLRIGMALPVTINLPFKLIHSAALGVHRDGTGDLPLELVRDEHIAFFMLWPHARRWHFWKPQPALRSIAEPERVAEILRLAVTEAGSHRLAAVGQEEPKGNMLPSAA